MLDPSKPLSVNYGGIIGLQATGGPEVVRVLILPNLKEYEVLITDAMEEGELRRKEAEMMVSALISALQSLEQESTGLKNGIANGDAEGMRSNLRDKVGPVIAEKAWTLGGLGLARAILEG